MKRIGLTLLALMMTSCGDQSEDVADIVVGNGGVASYEIRNGEVANEREYQGVGAIITSAGEPLCSGSLISRSVVLTAAQCLRNRIIDPELYFSIGPENVVEMWERNPGAANRFAKVKVARQHPLFENTEGMNLSFDVGLLRLERPETRRWKNVPRYPINQEDIYPGTRAIGVGFGDSLIHPPGIRTRGEFLVTRMFGGEGPPGVYFSNGILEVQPGNALNQMICPGDVGGPLLHEGGISGVASFRYVAECPAKGAGYHIATARLASWIADRVNELDPPGACTVEDGPAFATRLGGCKDNATGAVWSDVPTWTAKQSNAVAYCDGLVQGGFSDWRLASKEELRALDMNMQQTVVAQNLMMTTGTALEATEPAPVAPVVAPCHDQKPYPRAVEVRGMVWSATVNNQHVGVIYDFESHKYKVRNLKQKAAVLCVRNVSPL